MFIPNLVKKEPFWLICFNVFVGGWMKLDELDFSAAVAWEPGEENWRVGKQVARKKWAGLVPTKNWSQWYCGATNEQKKLVLFYVPRPERLRWYLVRNDQTKKFCPGLEENTVNCGWVVECGLGAGFTFCSQHNDNTGSCWVGLDAPRCLHWLIYKHSELDEFMVCKAIREVQIQVEVTPIAMGDMRGDMRAGSGPSAN